MMEDLTTIVGQLRNKPDGGSEVFTGEEWVHYSNDDYKAASMRVFNYLNPDDKQPKATQ